MVRDIVVFCRNIVSVKFFFVAFFFLALGGCAAIIAFAVMRYGPGVFPDSTKYVAIADNFLDKNTFSIDGKPITHWPPVYPFLLACVSAWWQIDLLQASRLLGAVLLGINVILFGFSIYICTEYNILAAFVGVLYFLSSESIVFIHLMVWSEPTFIMFVMVAFLFVSFYVAFPETYLFFIVFSVSTSFALITRYVGITLLLPICLFLFSGNRSLQQKNKDVFLFLVVSIFPLSFWLIRNVIVAETITNRSLVFHSINVSHVKEAINTFHDFMFLLDVPLWLKTVNLMIVILLVLTGRIFLYRKKWATHCVGFMNINFSDLCLLFSLVYISCIVISLSYFDAHTSFGSRILLPCFIAFFVSAIVIIWSLTYCLKQKFVWYGFLVFILVFVCINGNQTVSTITAIYQDGLGYNSQHWRNSETIAYIKENPDLRGVYSNGPDVIMFLTGKNAVMIPKKTNPNTRKPNNNYEKQLNQMYSQCKADKAIIVYLEGFGWRWYLPSFKELESKSENSLVLKKFRDGVIYSTNRLD